jgi:hypothetical protein
MQLGRVETHHSQAPHHEIWRVDISHTRCVAVDESETTLHSVAGSDPDPMEGTRDAAQ